MVAVCPFNYLPDPRNPKQSVEMHLFLFNDLLMVSATIILSHLKA